MCFFFRSIASRLKNDNNKKKHVYFPLPVIYKCCPFIEIIIRYEVFFSKNPYFQTINRDVRRSLQITPSPHLTRPLAHSCCDNSAAQQPPPLVVSPVANPRRARRRSAIVKLLCFQTFSRSFGADRTNTVSQILRFCWFPAATADRVRCQTSQKCRKLSVRWLFGDR